MSTLLDVTETTSFGGPKTLVLVHNEIKWSMSESEFKGKCNDGN